MARDWHEDFKRWAKPPSETEEQKASNAASMINDAIRASPALARRGVSVYATGSYRNNTNVRLGSDIDVAIVLNDGMFFDLPIGLTAAQVGITVPLDYGLADFRSDVALALTAKFGHGGVKPGKKTFNITANSYRLEADATVFLQYRRYTGAKTAAGGWHYEQGVELRPADNPNARVINWHDDHYAHGIVRNDATGRRFKRVTRILKRLRDEMSESGRAEAQRAAKPMNSFLIECLVFNASDACFGRVQGSYYEDVRAVIGELWQKTEDDVVCTFDEVNRKKKLFGPGQDWTQQQANKFLYEAWLHAGYGR